MMILFLAILLSLPFHPENAAVISDPSDLIAHCSTFAFDGKGGVYFAYYKDSQQPKEHSVNLTTYPVLAKTNLASLNDIVRKDIIHSGDTVGSYHHGKRAPYDPNLLFIGKTLMVYFNGYTSGQVTFCVREYYPETDSFKNDVTVCKLRYKNKKGQLKSVDLNSKNCYSFYDEMGIPAKYHDDLCISSRFVFHNGEYYAVLANVFSELSRPIVVKTTDGVNFDVVFVCKEFEYGACEGCLEISGNEYYVAMRNSGCPKDAQGTYLAKYSETGECLCLPRMLGKCQSKPAIIEYNKRLYVFYNAYPNLNTEWGNVARSRLRIARIDKSCNIEKTWDITNDSGIHYPYVGKYGGSLYLSFTEDRKKVDVKQCRSNISFTKVIFEQ